MNRGPEYVDGLWERTGGSHPLRIYPTFQELVEDIPSRRRLVEAIPGGRKILICVDDRLPGSSSLPAGADYVHMAGEGILNPNGVKDLRRARIMEIIPHRDCGAKGIYARETSQGGNSDDLGLAAVRILADQLGVPINRFVRADEMVTNTHYARVTYYDFTSEGVFNWSRVPDMPPGFIISRTHLSDPGYAQQEAGITVDIALGEHGFGSRFTQRTPYYLVAVGDDATGSAMMNRVIDELNGVAAKYQPKVEVDSMIVR